MRPIRKLFTFVHAAHQSSLGGVHHLMSAIQDHEDEYPESTISELENAAEKFELSARTIRAQIAVFRYRLQSDQEDDQ